jgi:lipopolysaccharide export system permease protein
LGLAAEGAMKILQRYLLKEFFKPLLFIILVFVGLYIIAQLVDDMRNFVAHKPPLTVIILYYLYRIPFYTVQVMPLAVLLSCLLSLGQLSRQNELIAMRSCGVSIYQVALPLLAAALGIVLLLFIFDEAVIPYTNPKAEYIKKVKVEGKSEQDYTFQRERVTRSTSGNRILFMQRLDAMAGRMEGVIYFELLPPLGVRRRLDAPRAYWLDGNWIFEKGVVRDFDPDGNLTAYRTFAEMAIPFKESPRDFVREEKETNQLLSMPLRDLSYRIRLLREMGNNTAQEEVNFHLKIAFPFASLVLALLGISLPFIFPSGQRTVVGAAIGFVITLATGFFYIGFVAVGTSLGNNGTLSPVISVWIANVFFSFLGVWLLRLAKT